MDIRNYEWKSPSYELQDRSYPIDPRFKENSRFVYDEAEGVWRSKAEAKDEISLLFTGDLLCQENILNAYRTEDGYDFSPCFHFVRPLLKSADFTAGNLETPIAHTAPYRGEILTHEGPYYCNAPLQYLEALSDAGFDMLYTANNHTIDAGARGLIETIENVRKFGFMQTGTFAEKGDKFLIVDICGFKVGFVSFAFAYNSMDVNLTEEGKETLLNTYSDAKAKEIYDAMRAKGAEFVVCFPHWGKEYTNTIIARQRDAAETMTKIGYDIITGCHAHVIQKAAVINKKPVLYSMGNLISHLNANEKIRETSQLTLIYSLKLKRTEEGLSSEVAAIPCKILRKEGAIPYSVVPIADIPISDEIKAKVAMVAEDVAREIQHDAIPVVTDYKLSEAALSEFAEAEKQFPDKLAALRPVTRGKAAAKAKVIDQVLDRGGVYAIFKDHAELVYLVTLSGSGTFAPPKEVKGKPVTAYNSPSTGNDRTQVFYLPETVESIGPGMFRDFKALESLRSFNGLKTIGMGAFENCTAMSGIILPPTMETICDFAFRGCTKLMSIKIPESVTYIADNAFEGCDKLTICCEEGTYADGYAKKNNIPYLYMPLPKKVVKETPKAQTKSGFKPFAGAAMVIEDAAEMDEIRKTLPPVKMGPMNGPKDPHPLPIRAACAILGCPLPEDAVCAHQPSYYIKPKGFDGKLETIIKQLGDRMPKIPKAKLEKEYRLFRQQYQSQECLDRNAVDFTILFTDYLLFARERGFLNNGYWDYELYNKEIDARETFLNEGVRTRIAAACNDRAQFGIYRDKAIFNTTFAKFVRRDWLDTTTCSFDEFKQFLSRHEQFFGKPVRGSGGAGARIIKNDSDTAENLFAICQADDLIVEEIVKQHKDLAAVNESTLNTVRINTLHCADDTVKITLTVARFGRSGNVVDNFHGGGVGAIVDIDTGIITTEAINRVHIRKPIHPDSKIPLLGFKYPEWEKVKAAVCEAATMVPGMRHVGWDVSVTEDGNVEFIEGNCRPNVDVLQSPDQIGRRDRYLPYIPALEKLKEIEYEELPPLVITEEMMQPAKPKTAKSKSAKTSASKPAEKKTSVPKAPKKKPSFLTRVKRKIKKTLFGKK